MSFPRNISAHRASVTERSARAAAIVARLDALPDGVFKKHVLWRAGYSDGTIYTMRHAPAKATAETLDVFEATLALLDDEGVELFTERAERVFAVSALAESRG